MEVAYKGTNSPLIWNYMDRKPLIAALVLLVIIAGGLYFVLMKGPTGEVTPENVPSGAVTKSGEFNGVRLC